MAAIYSTPVTTTRVSRADGGIERALQPALYDISHMAAPVFTHATSMPSLRQSLFHKTLFLGHRTASSNIHAQASHFYLRLMRKTAALLRRYGRGIMVARQRDYFADKATIFYEVGCIAKVASIRSRFQHDLFLSLERTAAVFISIFDLLAFLGAMRAIRRAEPGGTRQCRWLVAHERSKRFDMMPLRLMLPPAQRPRPGRRQGFKRSRALRWLVYDFTSDYYLRAFISRLTAGECTLEGAPYDIAGRLGTRQMMAAGRDKIASRRVSRERLFASAIFLMHRPSHLIIFTRQVTAEARSFYTSADSHCCAATLFDLLRSLDYQPCWSSARMSRRRAPGGLRLAAQPTSSIRAPDADDFGDNVVTHTMRCLISLPFSIASRVIIPISKISPLVIKLYSRPLAILSATSSMI